MRICSVTAAMVAFPALVPAAASAHGRIPAPVSITRGPAGSNGLLIGTTFGGVISTDGGSSWRWICEESIGYGGNLDPAFVWSPAGTLFLPSYDGLYVSRDRGCSFDLHPSIGPNLSSAAAVDPRDANVIFATRVETMNDGSTRSALMRSTDDGRTFAPTPLAQEPGAFSGIAIAPGAPDRLYVSGWSYRPALAWLFRSDDGGVRWESIPQAITGTTSVRVLAVSPADEDVVFTQWNPHAGTRRLVLRSEDGGRTSRQVFQVETDIRGLSIAPGGETVFIAADLLYRSTDGGRTFAPLTSPAKNACVNADGDTVYACGWPWSDRWAMAGSTDGGQTFTGVFELKELSGIQDCPAGTRGRDICEVYWPLLAETLGITIPPPNPPPVVVQPEPEQCTCVAAHDRGLPGAAAALLVLAAAVSLAARRRVWLLCLILLAACSEEKQEPSLSVPELVFAQSEHWPERSSYPGVGNGRIVITNNLEDTVSLFDLDQIDSPDFAELARVPVGLVPVELEGPHHAAIDPRGEFYYVAISNYVPGTGSGPHGAHGTGTGDGYALKYRASDNRLIASARVDPSPGDIIASADGRSLYVSHYDLVRIQEVLERKRSAREIDSRLIIIDAATMERKAAVPVCPAAHGMAESPDGKKLYVSCLSDEIAIVELAGAPYPVTRVKVAASAGNALAPRHQPYAVTVSPSDGTVWVSCLVARDLHALNPASMTFDAAKDMTLAGAPLFGAFSEAGDVLYMPTQIEDRIEVIDPAASSVSRTIAFSRAECHNAHQILFTPDRRRALVVCEGDHRSAGSLVVLDMTAGGSVMRSVLTGVFPDYVGIIRVAQ